MMLDSSVDPKIDLKSDYQNSSINDSIFFNSSISIDVFCLIAVIVVLLLAIALYLRLSKRKVLVEGEIIVILQVLRRSRAFTDESPC